MLKDNQQNLPPAATRFTDQSGSLTTIGRKFLQNLWNRTGEGPGVPYQVELALQATGATAASALQLGVDWNELLTTPASSGVKLRTLKQGQVQTVFNGGANALSVYPPNGVQIDALGVGNAYSLAAGKTQFFGCWSTLQYRTVQLG